MLVHTNDITPFVFLANVRCPYSLFLTHYFLQFKTLRMVYNVINQRLSGIVTNIILPLKDLELEGKDEKTAANIVGTYTIILHYRFVL